MVKNIKIIVLLSVALCTFSNVTYSAEDILEIDQNTGRGGEARRVEDPNEFKVCADFDNLPYSNGKQEGFENRIAELIAQDLGKKLSYQFWYDRAGYIRNTLNAGRCDVMIGQVEGNDMVLTSKPYYRSGYVFIYKKDSGLKINDWDSPDLKKAIIGVVGQTPPSRPLADKGLLANARPYRLYRDLTLPPGYMIDDLVKGDIDVAILWGPIGGYYAKKASVPLVVVPVPEYEDNNVHGKEYWNISIAVRKGDKDRIAMIQDVLDRRKDDINKILDDYGIPHVPVIADNIEQKAREQMGNKEHVEEKKGEAIPKLE